MVSAPLQRSAATRSTDLVNVSSIAADRYLAGMALPHLVIQASKEV
jgi:hypothetical protein